MLKEDFHKFVAMVNELVTETNQHYVCVLVGRARRQGSGLLVEAGVSAEQQVLSAFVSQRENRWRAERFQSCLAGESKASTGVSGVSKESMFFVVQRDIVKQSWLPGIVERF